MNQELIPFQGNNIRIAYRDDGEVGFCLSDIAKSIGLKRTTSITGRLDEKDVFSINTLTAGGEQVMSYVTEAGLYKAVGGSRKAMARELTQVLLEMLPRLRKQVTVVPGPLSDIQAMDMIILMAESHKKLFQEVNQIKSDVKEMRETQTKVATLLAPVPTLTSSARLNKVVKAYSFNTKLYYPDCWNQLYTEFKYRICHDGKRHDLKLIASHTGEAPIKVAERLGLIDDLLSLAIELFGGK